MARLLLSLTTLVSAVAVASAQYGTTAKKGTAYVIIGGGPAGLVLADQLSRSGTNQVILLEAGPDTINNQLIQGESRRSLCYEVHHSSTS